MFVTWDPEDGSEVVTFDFDEGDVGSKEAIRIEKAYGEGWESWLNGLRIKEAAARRCLLWWWLTQTHPHLPFRDVPDFKMRQLKVEMNSGEIRSLTKRMLLMKMDDDKRDMLQQALELDLREAMEREGVVEGDVVEADPK